MFNTQSNGIAGDFGVHITNNGVHPPEKLADITISQLVDVSVSDSDKIAKLKKELSCMHAQVQDSIRRIFKLTNANPAVRLQLTRVIGRDILTSLDIERNSE